MSKSSWVFDDDVATRFDTIARTHIPHYENVIDRCVHIAEKSFPDKKSARLIDVGSATGYTLQKLRNAGFTEVFGLDNSRAMLDQSRVQENLIHSGTFPKSTGPYDMILANWTLHFIKEKGRASYLQDIFDSLADNGIFILSDKMTSSTFVHDRYHDFKRSMGVSEKEIAEKEISLRGVLFQLPLEWYFEKLSKIGFVEVEIIDAAWCFKTLLCTKK